MLPMVMVLMERDWTDAAGCYVECGVTIVVRVANGGTYQSRNEAIIDKPVAVFTAIVPRTNKIGTLWTRRYSTSQCTDVSVQNAV